jgi:putative aminopeptidase FrvX
MERRVLLQLAERALRLPTAPYHEQHVKDFVMAFCRELRGVRIEVDRIGNVIARYRGGETGAPLVFVAHMDHPGFEMLGDRRAEFLGGVPKQMFKGARVRFNGKDGPVRATVSRVDAAAWPKRKLLTLKFKPGTASPEPGTPGMWDLPSFRVAGGKLHATAIDDVLGTVVMLATLAEVSQRKSRAHVWCAFTRAEEVGFQGALALIRANKIPKSALVVSIEMSKERPWARIGDGPIVRVGDRSTIFEPAASAFLWRVAERRRARDPGFQAQRCLMDGGSCEATAFAGFGYRAGGVCLPLGNYHNIGKNLRPRTEYVSVNDLEQLVKLTVATAEDWRGFDASAESMRQRLVRSTRDAPRTLRRI